MNEDFIFALELDSKIERLTTEKIDLHRMNRIKTLELLNAYEFFAFLVNNNQLTNQSVIDYFTPRMVKEIRLHFKDVSDVEKDNNAFTELKKLMNKLEDIK